MSLKTAPEEPNRWDDPRDEIDLDTEIGAALAEGDEPRLPGLLEDLVRLMEFQGRTREAAEYAALRPVMKAFAEADWTRALLMLTEELTITCLQPGLLVNKLLVALAHRFEREEAWLYALAAWKECEEEEEQEAQVEALKERLKIDDYNFELRWNEVLFAHYLQQVEEHPDCAEMWEMLALQHSLMAQPEQALDAAKRAVALEPTRRHAHQVIVEVLGDRGDVADLKAHLEALLESWSDDAWPHYAMSAHALHQEKDPQTARHYAEAALALAPDDTDVNELMCEILTALEAWEALAEQLEAMIGRADERFVLYDLYDDLAELCETRLEDRERATKVREMATLYQDAWRAYEQAEADFRAEPQSRIRWRILRNLLFEVGDWGALSELTFLRLEYEEEPEEIHELYEDLFYVYSNLLDAPPWRMLQAHLEERIEETEAPSLRLLLVHHLGWVNDQIALAERVASEEVEEERENDEVEEEEDEDPIERARSLAFVYGSRLYEEKGLIRVGSFLLTAPIFLLLLGGGMHGAGLWLVLCGGGLLGTWLLGGGILARLRPAGATSCMICHSRSITLHRLEATDPAYVWAFRGEGKTPFWWRCHACGYDSRSAYLPATSGRVKQLAQLRELVTLLLQAKEAVEELLQMKPEVTRHATERGRQVLVTFLSRWADAWELALALYNTHPRPFEALRMAAIDARKIPMFEPLELAEQKLWSELSTGNQPLEMTWKRAYELGPQLALSDAALSSTQSTLQALSDLVEASIFALGDDMLQGGSTFGL